MIGEGNPYRPGSGAYQGFNKGYAEAIVAQLKAKFGDLPADVEAGIMDVAVFERLQEIGERILDHDTLDAILRR